MLPALNFVVDDKSVGGSSQSCDRFSDILSGDGFLLGGVFDGMIECFEIYFADLD